MNTLKIDYPPELLWATQQDRDAFEAEARQLLAIKLYESGRLSTGLAAQLAQMPRASFIYLLGQHGLSPFGGDADELSDDLANAKQAASHDGNTE